MSIEHHPDKTTLITCSAGSTPEALCAVVASHISMCPDCFQDLRKLESIGLALFDNLPTMPLEHGPPRPEPAEPEPSVASAMRGAAGQREVPRTIRAVIGKDLDALEWKPGAEGVLHHVITLSPGAKGDLRLIKLAPGARLPRHRHRGEELTLVLRGAYHDEHAKYSVGDLSDLDDEVEHSVVADPLTGCILLMASEHRPDFLEA